MLTAEIKKMPTKDKIILMEEIWDTLSHDEAHVESPAWHREVINERQKLIKNGNATFISINELKFGKK